MRIANRATPDELNNLLQSRGTSLTATSSTLFHGAGKQPLLPSKTHLQRPPVALTHYQVLTSKALVMAENYPAKGLRAAGAPMMGHTALY